MFDEASVFLASRLVAFLLEPKRSGSEEFLDLAEGLELGAAAFRSKGSSSSLAQAQRMTIQASQAMQGQSPRTNGIGHKLLEVLRGFRTHSFSGEPKRDWIEARRRLATGCGPWVDLASDAEQLIAFQRGKRISEGLSEVWQENGCYIGARVVLDTSLSQDQLLSGASDLRGIHVMTVHKSKGKEFDAVVILDDSNNSPLIFCRELAPYSRSRRLLRVGITRARHHVLMLTDQFSPSTLLAGHWL
jgi:DNA helicase-2/ATP-dependent DNA helicase PcrA